MTPDVMLSTARFLESAARHILAEARQCTAALDQEEIRFALSGLYARAKTLHDARAAALAPPRQTGGHATNVGDPNAHGAPGGAKKQ